MKIYGVFDYYSTDPFYIEKYYLSKDTAIDYVVSEGADFEHLEEWIVELELLMMLEKGVNE